MMGDLWDDLVFRGLVIFTALLLLAIVVMIVAYARWAIAHDAVCDVVGFTAGGQAVYNCYGRR